MGGREIGVWVHARKSTWSLADGDDDDDDGEPQPQPQPQALQTGR